MTRHEAREQAFLMLCESGFAPDRSAEEIYETAKLARDVEEDVYVRECVEGVLINRAMLDEKIAANAKGWSLNRLSVVTCAILRLGAYELFCRTDIPIRVSMNEAIELSKKYDDEKARAFVNGVLNALAQEVKATREDEG